MLVQDATGSRTVTWSSTVNGPQAQRRPSRQQLTKWISQRSYARRFHHPTATQELISIIPSNEEVSPHRVSVRRRTLLRSASAGVIPVLPLDHGDFDRDRSIGNANEFPHAGIEHVLIMEADLNGRQCPESRYCTEWWSRNRQILFLPRQRRTAEPQTSTLKRKLYVLDGRTG